LKVVPSTVVPLEIEIPVVFETPNVAESAGPSGTVAGVQFEAVFQSPEPGLRFHVALPALAKLATKIKMVALSTARRAVFLIR
jgi:hypothetical protein